MGRAGGEGLRVGEAASRLLEWCHEGVYRPIPIGADLLPYVVRAGTSARAAPEATRGRQASLPEPLLLREQFTCPLERHRTRPVEALPVAAVRVSEPVGLVGLLDAFGDGGQAAWNRSWRGSPR